MMKNKISTLIMFIIAVVVIFILIDGKQLIDKNYSRVTPIYERTVTREYSGYPAPIMPIIEDPDNPTATLSGYVAPPTATPRPTKTPELTSTLPPPPPLPEGQVP